MWVLGTEPRGPLTEQPVSDLTTESSLQACYCFKLFKLLFNQLEVNSKFHVHFHLCVFICVCGGIMCLWRSQDNLKCPPGMLLTFSGPGSLTGLDLTNQTTLTGQ